MTGEQLWQVIQKVLIGSISFAVGLIIGELLSM